MRDILTPTISATVRRRRRSWLEMTLAAFWIAISEIYLEMACASERPRHPSTSVRIRQYSRLIGFDEQRAGRGPGDHCGVARQADMLY